jgi:hypothetical protein
MAAMIDRALAAGEGPWLMLLRMSSTLTRQMAIIAVW